MKQNAFESARRPLWRQFEAQLDRLESIPRTDRNGGSREALKNFTTHYTRLSRDLALARSRGYSQRLIEELNALVGRGHNLMYARRPSFLSTALAYLFGGLPRRVRHDWPFVLVSSMAFLLPAIGIGYAITDEPELLYSVMPPEQVYSLETMYDPGAEHFGRERQSASDFSMFGFYIQNNIGISFQVFATGILAGIGSLFYLIYNGLILGAVTTHMLSIGYGTTFLSFVVGHGAFELTAIVLSGAAGLKLGYALIHPGQRPRAEALKQAAGAAVPMIVGATIMLVVAAFLEAFWSSTRFIPVEVKYAAGAMLWSGVFAYFLLVGRLRGA